MRPYEIMLVLDPELDQEEAMEALLQRLQGVVTDGGGEITKKDPWGKRRLAYEVRGNTEGYYVVMNFRSESSVAQELERVVKLTDGVIRHLLVRLDEK
ncbi:MAG: 30S ribosomal protein S6 [Firmicutes bacterium]|nr:30S ribosomal protein S6 [Bacillota bacterium]